MWCMTTPIITYIDSTDFWPPPYPLFPTFKNGYLYLNRDYTRAWMNLLLKILAVSYYIPYNSFINCEFKCWQIKLASVYIFMINNETASSHCLHCVGECNFQTLDNEPDVMMSGNQHRLGNICGRLRHRLFVIEHCDQKGDKIHFVEDQLHHSVDLPSYYEIDERCIALLRWAADKAM